MKALVVSPMIPYPPNSGLALLSHGLLRALCRRYDVTYLSLSEDTDDAAVDELSQLGACVRVLPFPNKTSRIHQLLYRVLNLARSIATLTPIAALYHTPRGLREELRLLVRTQAFDVIEIHQSIASSLVREIPSGLKILYAYELQTATHEEFAKRASLLRRLWIRFDSYLMRTHERRWLRHFDCILATQHSERLRFKQELRGNVRVETMPLPVLDAGADRQNFAVTPQQDDFHPRIVFIGVMDYMPNIDSVQFLVEEIWPHVIRQLPTAVLELVGRNPTDDVLHWHGQDGISVTGAVSSIEPYLENATVVVVPARFPLGVKVKLLQALARGKAIVATPAAVEGLDLPPNAVVVRTRAADFAEAILRLVNDRQKREQLERAALAAASDFTAEAAADYLADLYNNLGRTRRSLS